MSRKVNAKPPCPVCGRKVRGRGSQKYCSTACSLKVEGDRRRARVSLRGLRRQALLAASCAAVRAAAAKIGGVPADADIPGMIERLDRKALQRLLAHPNLPEDE